MDHPFANTLRSFLIYLSVWISIAGIHIFLLTFIYQFPVNIAIADSLIYNFAFALFGIVIWYIVKFSVPSKPTLFNYAINHLTSITVILLIWINASDAILSSLFNDNVRYTNMLDESHLIRILMGIVFYAIISLIYYLIIYYHDLQTRVQQEASLNERLREAEIKMLRSQINPHFLFNALNSVSSLTITNAVKAQEMLIQLSDYLRYTVKNHAGDMNPLSDELENIKQYLKIEQIRFGNKMEFKFDVDERCLIHTLPAMLLQPIFENAVKHGVYESTEPITIETSCRFHDSFIEITITNNYDLQARKRTGEGIGIQNIKERLKLIYHAENLIEIRQKPPVFTVILRIPVTSPSK